MILTIKTEDGKVATHEVAGAEIVNTDLGEALLWYTADMIPCIHGTGQMKEIMLDGNKI